MFTRAMRWPNSRSRISRFCGVTLPPLMHATSIRVYQVPDLSGVNSADERQEERTHKVRRPALAQDAGVAKFLIIIAAGRILK